MYKFLSRFYNYVRCVPRTLFFNFYYLPFNQAIRFPVIVSHRTRFQCLSGKVVVPSNAKTAKIRLGFGRVQVADHRSSKLIWNLEKGGCIEFGNNNKIGTGCKLYVAGRLMLGTRVNFTGECSLTCNKRITIGDNCLISWRTILMDTDFHVISGENGDRLNPDREISIGKSVWVGAASTILKGSCIGDNSIVAAGANLAGKFDGACIVGGNPAKVIGSMKGKRFQQ